MRDQPHYLSFLTCPLLVCNPHQLLKSVLLPSAKSLNKRLLQWSLTVIFKAHTGAVSSKVIWVSLALFYSVCWLVQCYSHTFKYIFYLSYLSVRSEYQSPQFITNSNNEGVHNQNILRARVPGKNAVMFNLTNVSAVFAADNGSTRKWSPMSSWSFHSQDWFLQGLPWHAHPQLMMLAWH